MDLSHKPNIYIVDSYPSYIGDETLVLKTDIKQLKKCISRRKEVAISYNGHFEISTDIFSDFTGHSITLRDVLLVGDELPSCVTYFYTNRRDQKLFNVKNLTIPLTEDFTVPPSVETLCLSGGDKPVTITGHDNLRSVFAYCSDHIIHLLNCNNLQEVYTNKPVVYGDFMNYLSELGINSSPDISKTYEYLKLFKNVTKYSGYMDKTMLSILDSLREIYSYRVDVESLDDIPDSIEVLCAEVAENYTSVGAKAILEAKPNIKCILAHEQDAHYILEHRHDVEIAPYDDDDAFDDDLDLLVENHNKKLKSLSVLC